MTFLRWAKLFEIEIFFEYLQQFYSSFYNVVSNSREPTVLVQNSQVL
jgi:hypothetical protein